MFRKPGVAVLFLFILISTFVSVAQELYITNEPKESIELLNLSINQLTTLFNIGAEPDDLVLNAQGQLLYSIGVPGTIDMYDPTTGINSVVVSGVKYARDLCIEPGGETMLIALYSPGEIARYNFVTGQLTILTKKLGTVDGIAYDAYGNLYAVANHNTIVQIDPDTGAVLNTLVLEPHHSVNGGDGMTYDPYTNELWTSHNGTLGFGVEEIETNASGFTGSFTLHLTPGVTALDGIKSDGQGNLYIGAIHTVAVYNIPTDSVTKNIVVHGADGISLVPGTY